jgi:hypothetical protein
MLSIRINSLNVSLSLKIKLIPGIFPVECLEVVDGVLTVHKHLRNNAFLNIKMLSWIKFMTA